MRPTLFTGREKIASVRDFARTPTKQLSQGITRLIKGKQSVGYFIPEDEVDLFLERLEVARNESWKEWEDAEKSQKDGAELLKQLAA